jgi:hypothetical protein
VFRNAVPALLACLLAGALAGCGSAHKHALSPQAAALMTVRLCFRHQGYSVAPESTKVRGTAPRRFEFTAVWNLLDPDRIALAVTFSKSAAGAAQAAAYTRKLNAKLSKGSLKTPVVQFGRIDVLWTSEPGRASRHAIYGCVRPAA